MDYSKSFTLLAPDQHFSPEASPSFPSSLLLPRSQSIRKPSLLHPLLRDHLHLWSVSPHQTRRLSAVKPISCQKEPHELRLLSRARLLSDGQACKTAAIKCCWKSPGSSLYCVNLINRHQRMPSLPWLLLADSPEESGETLLLTYSRRTKWGTQVPKGRLQKEAAMGLVGIAPGKDGVLDGRGVISAPRNRRVRQKALKSSFPVKIDLFVRFMVCSHQFVIPDLRQKALKLGSTFAMYSSKEEDELWGAYAK